MKKASTAMSSTLRCFKVLELLADEPFELSFTELAARLDVPKASAHRLCTTLIEANLITQEPVTRRYMLSSHALWIGSGYLRHSPLIGRRFSPCRSWRDSFRGTVQLGVLDRIMCCSFTRWVIRARPTRSPMWVCGARLNATASGKIFLAGMPSDEVDRIMAKCTEKYTSSTITSSARMKQEIAQVKKMRLCPQRGGAVAGLLGVGGRGCRPG